MSVTLTIDDAGVATLLLGRPAKRNALDRLMLEAFAARVDELAGRDDVRAVVVRGAGSTFCAGADIGDWIYPSAAEATELANLGREAFTGLARLPVPSVALIEGTAVGGGFELALACDIRIAASDALMGLPELRLGNLPAWGGLARLLDVAGLGVARFLLLTGELISGARAAELQVVTTVCSADELDSVLDRTLGWLSACDPVAVGVAKTVLSGFEHDHRLEPVIASYTAGLASSQQRKQQFLDRQAARRAARRDPAEPDSPAADQTATPAPATSAPPTPASNPAPTKEHA